MRMKKLMILAVAAIALVACSRTFETHQATGQAIGFGTWTETMTKAYTSTWADGDAFSVFGTKTVASQTVVFDDQPVVYDGTTSKWGYTPIQYWDLSASNYTFYAVLPFVDGNSDNKNDILAAEANAGDYAKEGLFVTSEITFNAPTTNNQDILVANKYSRDKGATAMSTSSVDLVFNHMASLVDLKVKMDASLASIANTVTISVTDADLTDIYTKGSFVVTGYDASTKKPTYAGTFGWTLDDDTTPTEGDYPASATLPLAVTSETTYTGGNATTTTPEAQDLFTSYVLMPQDLNNNQKLTLSYTITTKDSADNEATATYSDIEIPLKNFVKADNTSNDGTAVTGWRPGYHYTYYVTIGAAAIEFTATVNDWVDAAGGYHYLIN